MKFFLFILSAFILFINIKVTYGLIAPTACCTRNSTNGCVDNLTQATCFNFLGSVNSTSFFNNTSCALTTCPAPDFGCCPLGLGFSPPCQNLTRFDCTVANPNSNSTFASGTSCNATTCPVFVGKCRPINNTCIDGLLSSTCAGINGNFSAGQYCTGTEANNAVCTGCPPISTPGLNAFVSFTYRSTSTTTFTAPNDVHGNIGGLNGGISGDWVNYIFLI